VNKNWTAEQEETLRALVGTMSSTEIGKRMVPPRHKFGVLSKIRILGLKGKTAGTETVWTEAELEALKNKPADMSYSVFGRMHGKSHTGTLYWARKFGMTGRALPAGAMSSARRYAAARR
jgi:hypothetical protein